MTAQIINLAEYRAKKKRKEAYNALREELQKSCRFKLSEYPLNESLFQEMLEELKRDIAARSRITPYELFRISTLPLGGIIPA